MVEMTRAGLSPRSKIHGHSALVISWLYHLDLQGSGRPSSSSSGAQPLIPVLSHSPVRLPEGLHSCSVGTRRQEDKKTRRQEGEKGQKKTKKKTKKRQKKKTKKKTKQDNKTTRHQDIKTKRQKERKRGREEERKRGRRRDGPSCDALDRPRPSRAQAFLCLPSCVVVSAGGVRRARSRTRTTPPRRARKLSIIGLTMIQWVATMCWWILMDFEP